MPHGVLHIAKPAEYTESRPDTPTQEALELLATLAAFPITPPQAAPVTDWFRITQAIRCGTRLSLEAERPGSKVSIRFHDISPFDGEYHIRIPLQQRSERGRISSVESIEGNRLVDHRHAMLRPFALRYVVTTTAEDRGGTQSIWRIGVSDVTFVPEGELHSDDPPNA
jgi:hypothetical protein